MDELGAVCVPLIGPIIERRVGLIRGAAPTLFRRAGMATVIEREMAGSGGSLRLNRKPDVLAARQFNVERGVPPIAST